MKYVQPYDQPSTPNAPYVDLDAIMGVDGSIPPAKFFNNLQAELLAVITAAGLTPNDANLHQLLDAILALIPTPTGAPADSSLVHWGIDTSSTPNALALSTVTPGFTTLGQGFSVNFVPLLDCSGAATITLTPSSGPAVTKPLLRPDGTALQAGDYKGLKITQATLDPNDNSGNGAFRLASIPPVIPAAPNPAALARFWVEFDGLSSTIRRSFNVASVVRVAQGTYRIAFSTPMPTDDYAVAGVASNNFGYGCYVNLANVSYGGYVAGAKPRTVNDVTIFTSSYITGPLDNSFVSLVGFAAV